MDSSSEEEDFGPPPVSTGFKLNLGSVAANEVDDAKPFAKQHTPKGSIIQGLLAAEGHNLAAGGAQLPGSSAGGAGGAGGGGSASTSARGQISRASCSLIDLGALAQLGVQEGVVEQIEQGLASQAVARRGSLVLGIGGGISGGGSGGSIEGGGGGGGGGVLTRQASAVPVDTTGDGKVDALAIDSNKDGRIDALIKLGDLGGTEAEAVGAALPGPAAGPTAEARAHAVVAGGGKGGKASRRVLAEALAAMRPLDAFPVAQPLDGRNAAQSMSSSIISLASRCFNLGISHDRGISKVTTY